MKKTVLSLIAALALALPSSLWAATEADRNGDRVLTIAEVQAVYPEITTDTFTALDVNADGTLDEGEILAAQEAGIIPPSEG